MPASENCGLEAYPALRSALQRVTTARCRQLYDDPKGRLGQELFIMAQSDGGVCHERPAHIPWSVCRGYLRWWTRGQDCLVKTRSYYSDAGLACMTVQMLVDRGLDDALPVPEQHLAVRTLLRHFDCDLKLNAPRDFDGYPNARAYWYARKRCIEDRAVIKKTRLCCDREARVGVGLRADSAPRAPSPYILPQLHGRAEEQGRYEERLGDCRSVQARELQMAWAMISDPPLDSPVAY